MASRKSKYYDEDDFDDGYSDEDYWEDEDGDAYDEPAQAPPPKKPQPPPKLPPPKPKAAPAKAQAEAIKNQTFSVAPGGSKANAFDKPSPDDVVLAAQKGSHIVTQQVAGLSLEQQAPQPKPAAAPQKPLSEYKPEPDLQKACDKALGAERGQGGKPRLHLVVLGHVDAGKSTLMGRFMYELGHIEEKVVHKTKREATAAGKASFAWAWMLDERPEERARGVTVDVAVTRFETPHRLVTLLDAPGHRDFVPNMIAGAAQADACLLIVDGSPGGFEAGFDPATGVSGGGQTREHAQLARSLGIEQAIIVITKLDTCDYSQERFEHIKAQLEPFLKTTCGFKSSSLQWLPAVGPAGLNLVHPPTDEPLLSSWYTGNTLVQAIDTFQPAHRLLEKPFRLPISETGSKSGRGGVAVGGKIEGGAIRAGSKVLILPSKEYATVKSIEIHGKTVDLAMAGDSIDLVLTGIEPNAVSAGSLVCHPDYPAPLATAFEARIVVLEVPLPILKGQQVTLHAHAARESGHISGLVSLLDGTSGEVKKVRPRCLVKGSTAVITVVPSRSMCLEAYADYKSLGRIALRDGGKTIAVGIVTSVLSTSSD